jgi:predicted ferric reductase
MTLLNPVEVSFVPSTATRTPPSAPPQWWRDLSGSLAWLLGLVVTALWVAGGGVQGMASASGALTELGRLTGLWSSALLLLQVLLMARIPWVEQAYGQDDLTARHRLVGFTSFSLMLAHLVFITVGYAAGTDLGVVGTFVDLVLTYPGMLLALAGTLALIMVVVTSIRAARRALRYESWHLIHLYAYLGAGLALPHQLWTGAQFLDSTPATVFWWGLWIAAVAAVLAFRVALPLWRSRRHRLRVDHVVGNQPGVTTIVVTGRRLERLAVRGGQYFQWRFLDTPGWTRAHPYSLSAAPNGRSLEVTVAHVGDGSAAVASLVPGTRVLVEGPYGRLHAGVRTRRKVLLMGSGIGITPLKAVLEELEQDPGDVMLIHRVRSGADRVLGPEIDAVARAKGASVIVVPGRRIPGRQSWLPQEAAHLDDAAALRHLVPDVAQRDVYLCGNPDWIACVVRAATTAGVPRAAIHTEAFSL